MPSWPARRSTGERHCKGRGPKAPWRPRPRRGEGALRTVGPASAFLQTNPDSRAARNPCTCAATKPICPGQMNPGASSLRICPPCRRPAPLFPEAFLRPTPASLTSRSPAGPLPRLSRDPTCFRCGDAPQGYPEGSYYARHPGTGQRFLVATFDEEALGIVTGAYPKIRMTVSGEGQGAIAHHSCWQYVQSVGGSVGEGGTRMQTLSALTAATCQERANRSGIAASAASPAAACP
jgi:hypothetical protein